MLNDIVVREMLPGGKSTAGYFTLVNHSDKTVTITQVQSDLSSRIEIHEHIMQDGMMKMQQVKNGIEIKPHGKVSFEPGGYHLMIFKDKKKIRKGTKFELKLLLSGNQTVGGKGTVVSVLDMQQKSESSHHHHH